MRTLESALSSCLLFFALLQYQKRIGMLYISGQRNQGSEKSALGLQSIPVCSRACKQGPERRILQRTAPSMCRPCLCAAVFQECGADTAHQRYAVLTGFGTLVQMSNSSHPFPDYPNTLPQPSFKGFPNLVLPKWDRENEVQAKDSRKL